MARDSGALSSEGARRTVALRDFTSQILAKLLLFHLRRVAFRATATGFEDFEGIRVDGRVFYCFRHEDVLALAVLLCFPAAERIFRSVDFVHDDGLWGMLSAGLARGLGYAEVTLHRGPFGRRIKDVQSLMRSPRSVAIAIDPGGPYGEVPVSLARLGEQCGAHLVPIVARGHRDYRLPVTPSLRFPIRGNRIAIAAGEAVRGGVEGARERLQEAFGRAQARASERLRRQPSTLLGR